MIIKANIKEAAGSLYGAKQRTILALIGIIIGIGSVIAMISVGTIVEEESLRQFKDMGTDILTIRKSFGGDKIRGFQRSISLDDAKGIPSVCPSIGEVAPYIQSSLQVRYAGKELNATCMGVTESFRDINKIRVKAGRFISDLDTFGYFCVIGGDLAAKLQNLGLQKPVGEKIKAGDHLFTVAGVIENVPMGGLRPYGLNDGIFIPITTSVRVFEKAEIRNIMARMAPDAHYVRAQGEISAYIKRKIKGANMRVMSAEELIGRMEKQMKLFTLLLGAVGSISLIVGGVGVMNVMLVSVAERRREIGIRRALGAKRGDIQSQFLIESMILSIIGGIFGIGLGVTASYAIAHFSKWQFLISYMAILLGFGVSSVVGIFFGFYPARQAARLDPITALRSE